MFPNYRVCTYNNNVYYKLFLFCYRGGRLFSKGPCIGDLTKKSARAYCFSVRVHEPLKIYCSRDRRRKTKKRSQLSRPTWIGRLQRPPIVNVARRIVFLVCSTRSVMRFVRVCVFFRKQNARYNGLSPDFVFRIEIASLGTCSFWVRGRRSENARREKPHDAGRLNE